MAKVMISVPEDFLQELDLLSQAQGLSRSETIRVAVERWRQEAKEGQAETVRRERLAKAVELMDAYAKKYAHVRFSGSRYIRAWRDRDRLVQLAERPSKKKAAG